ncbi:hypothetical protein CH253_08080 [Rhodococcus sp. 06-156-3C]|uniref:hypothetical protein n=1 Tax=Rhodococcus sp. 06-156-3C TaxID=2022486 RepID=UPI000B9BCAEE|nr:hypothetical protein [Rhodococcus sp. 06-156-3C]OZD23811.1 hypothetical protein CH253_08080 [Rhodococcus sp. 06-156-3C]
MTMPNGAPPEGAYVINDGKKFGSNESEASVRGLIRNGALQGYGRAQTGWQGVTSALAVKASELEDFQLDMNGRLDLLESVEGYCSTFLSKNWNVTGNNVWRTLPFDSQLGPNKGADPFEDGIKMRERGLWRCDAHVTFYAAPSGWGGGNTPAAARLLVMNAETKETHTERRFDLVITPYGADTASFSNTFVIPEDDKFMVVCQVVHRRASHWLYGGTVRSALSVNKWDNGTANDVDLPVAPDGGTLT